MTSPAIPSELTEAPKTEAEVEAAAAAPKPSAKQKRTLAECEALVKSCDDDTVGLLLLAVYKEAVLRGIDPATSVKAATTATTAPSGRPTANVRDIWARVVTRLNRTARGGYRFDGSPIFGRDIIGREMSSVGVDEAGKTAPVVFGRKDMRGTFWLAVGEKGASFDMDGTPIVGMKLLIMSSSADTFEALCDRVEALLAGVEVARVKDRRTTEEKLAAYDNWEIEE